MKGNYRYVIVIYYWKIETYTILGSSKIIQHYSNSRMHFQAAIWSSVTHG